MHITVYTKTARRMMKQRRAAKLHREHVAYHKAQAEHYRHMLQHLEEAVASGTLSEEDQNNVEHNIMQIKVAVMDHENMMCEHDEQAQ